MPHAVLEFSRNVLEEVDFHRLFERLHAMLVATGEFERANIKSRVYPCEHYYVGDGNPQNAFVHLTLQILDGRDEAVEREVGERALGLLRETFAGSLAALNCTVTVEVRPMRRAAYFKAAGGRVPPESR